MSKQAPQQPPTPGQWALKVDTGAICHCKGEPKCKRHKEIASIIRGAVDEALLVYRLKLGYQENEKRVCDYLQEIMPEIGCGDDPIGYLIASHSMLRKRRQEIAGEAAERATTAERQRCARIALSHADEDCAGNCCETIAGAIEGGEE